MSFFDRLKEITKPKVFEAQFDFGLGDGEETIKFQTLSYTQRKKILVDRMEVVGKDKDGNDQTGIKPSSMFEMNAEMLAASFIGPDGKPVATKDALMNQWDSNLVDKLADLCRKTIGLFGDGEKEKADPENPSNPQS